MPSWYLDVKHGEQLRQGEIVCSCRVIKPILTGDVAGFQDDNLPLPENRRRDSVIEIEGMMMISNIIILSQSCDLNPKNPPDFVVACPVYPLHDRATDKEDNTMGNYANIENLISESMAEWHLLDQCPLDTLKKDYLAVDFRSVYSIPFDSVLADAEKAKTRWCLKAPFRERLSQAFARFFMRIGLENEDEIRIAEDDWIYVILERAVKESNENAQGQYEDFTLSLPYRDPETKYWRVNGSYTEIAGLTQTTSRHRLIIETTKDRGTKESDSTKSRFKKRIGILRNVEGYKSYGSPEEEDQWIGYKKEGEYASRVEMRKVEPYTPCDDYLWFPATNFHHIVIDYIDEF